MSLAGFFTRFPTTLATRYLPGVDSLGPTTRSGFFTGLPTGFGTPYFLGPFAGLPATPKLPPFEVDLIFYLSAAGLGVPIHPGHIPQGKDPIVGAVSFFAVSEDPSYTLLHNAGLTARVYQFSAWSSSYLTACSIENDLRRAMHGFRGIMGQTRVSSCRLQQCLDLPFETEVDGDDDGTYQRVVEYRIAFREVRRLFVQG